MKKEFFDALNAEILDILDNHVKEQITKALNKLQNISKNAPVAGLMATEYIANDLLALVDCPVGETIETELTTDTMDMKLVKKNFASTVAERNTVMMTKDNLMLLPDQAELVTKDGTMQITMASHHNLQVNTRQ